MGRLLDPAELRFQDCESNRLLHLSHKKNILPPETFETSRKKAIFEAASKTHDRRTEEESAQELAYDVYRTKALDSYISGNYSEKKYKTLIERKRRELLP